MESPNVKIRVVPLTKKENMEALMRLKSAQVEICNEMKDVIISQTIDGLSHKLEIIYNTNFK
jgi:hypothetical protein